VSRTDENWIECTGYITITAGGYIAEIVACLSIVPKGGGSNLSAYYCFVIALFIPIANIQELSIYTYVSCGFDAYSH
jgi:hypothetical protein